MLAGWKTLSTQNNCLKTKVRICKSIIRPVLTYAVETRADTSETKQILETTEMNTLRKIVAKTRLYRVGNHDFREQCG